MKGKVVIDAFRLISPQTVLAGQEPRQTTSNIGQINKPSIQALIHGLNRHYYSIVVNYRKTDLEQAMLMNLHKRNWTEGLTLKDFKGHKEGNEKAIKVRVFLFWCFFAFTWGGGFKLEQIHPIINVLSKPLNPPTHLDIPQTFLYALSTFDPPLIMIFSLDRVTDPLHLFPQQSMLTLSEAYNKSVQEESTLTPEQLKTRHVGKQDPKRHLEEAVEKAMGDQVVQNLGTMLLAEL